MSANLNFKELVSNAIRYWEPRRIIYNLVLALIVIGYFLAGLPDSMQRISVNGVLVVFILAVISNACYCAIYIPDIFAQISQFQALWQKIRWIPFWVGVVFASIITRWISMGMFSR
ncbi:MAG: hypothetical protein ABIP97_12550 [Chthoniobacterales bacterium]